MFEARNPREYYRAGKLNKKRQHSPNNNPHITYASTYTRSVDMSVLDSKEVVRALFKKAIKVRPQLKVIASSILTLHMLDAVLTMHNVCTKTLLTQSQPSPLTALLLTIR